MMLVWFHDILIIKTTIDIYKRIKANHLKTLKIFVEEFDKKVI